VYPIVGMLQVCCWCAAGCCRCAAGHLLVFCGCAGVLQVTVWFAAAGQCASGVLPVCFFRCSAGRCVSGVLSVFCILPVFCRLAAGVLLVSMLIADSKWQTTTNKQQRRPATTNDDDDEWWLQTMMTNNTDDEQRRQDEDERWWRTDNDEGNDERWQWQTTMNRGRFYTTIKWLFIFSGFASGVLPVCFRCSAGRCVSGVLSVFCILPVFCWCAAGVLLVATLAADSKWRTTTNKRQWRPMTTNDDNDEWRLWTIMTNNTNNTHRWWTTKTGRGRRWRTDNDKEWQWWMMTTTNDDEQGEVLHDNQNGYLYLVRATEYNIWFSEAMPILKFFYLVTR